MWLWVLDYVDTWPWILDVHTWMCKLVLWLLEYLIMNSWLWILANANTWICHGEYLTMQILSCECLNMQILENKWNCVNTDNCIGILYGEYLIMNTWLSILDWIIKQEYMIVKTKYIPYKDTVVFCWRLTWYLDTAEYQNLCDTEYVWYSTIK